MPHELDELAHAPAKLGIQADAARLGKPLSRQEISSNARHWMYLPPFPERQVLGDEFDESSSRDRPNDGRGDLEEQLRQEGPWVGTKLSGQCH